MDADSRSSRIFIIRKKSTKESKSRSQHLNSLKKLIVSMHLLETDVVVVVVVKELPDIFEFEFSVLLRGKTDPTLHQGNGHMYPDLQYLVVFEVVEDHLASNGSV